MLLLLTLLSDKSFFLQGQPSFLGEPSFFQVNHGVRQVILCKDAEGKIGLRVKAVNKGPYFIVLVKPL